MNFMKYILNPYYLLRNDVKRAAICSQDVNHSPAIDVSENWLSFIHPIYAMLLSFFSLPIELSVASENIAVFLISLKSIPINLFKILLRIQSHSIPITKTLIMISPKI